MKIKVKVKPNSNEEIVEKIDSSLFNEEGYEGLYYVKLKESPQGGKANLELLKILKRYFKKDVKIKAGFTSKDKVVEVED
jgi:uncharacterized protein (TIGR00251 family)